MAINELKEIRKKAKYSQDFIGEKLNISQSTYNKKENGINPFTIGEVKLMKTILKLTNDQVVKIFLN